MEKKTATNGEVNFIAMNIKSLAPIKGNKFAYGISRNIDRIIAEYKVVDALARKAAEDAKMTFEEFQNSPLSTEFFDMESAFDPFIIKEIPEGIEVDATQIKVLEFLMEPATFESTFNSDDNGKPEGPPVK